MTKRLKNKNIKLYCKTSYGKSTTKQILGSLFNSSIRTIKEYQKGRVIYKDEKIKIKIYKTLHLKHRDLLSVLIEDQTEQNKIITTSLIRIVRNMKYNNPQASVTNIYKFLNDLKEINIFIEEEGKESQSNIIDNFFNDKRKYKIILSEAAIKYDLLDKFVKLPTKINEEILQIPNKLTKSKAAILSLLLLEDSNKGIEFNKLSEILDMDVEKKSRFKHEMLENTELYAKFGVDIKIEKQVPLLGQNLISSGNKKD